MYRELNRENENTEEQLLFNEKLLNIQSKLKAPKKQYNNFGRYNYRSCEDILEAVKPLLEETGLTLIIQDFLDMIGERIYVKAVAKVSDGVFFTESSGFAREEETKKGMDGSQVTGAASSYARKYALNGLFLIDDAKDADATNTHGKEESKPQQKQQSQSFDESYVIPVGTLQGKKISEVDDSLALSELMKSYEDKIPDGLKVVIQSKINTLSETSQKELGEF